MQRNDVMHVLNDPLALELIRSKIPARVAYTSVDGSPRAVQRCWSSSRWLTLRLQLCIDTLYVCRHGGAGPGMFSV